MAVERTPSGSSLIDVLDRVLDKGIVIDAWVRVSLVGIDLVTVEARIVVASIDTYLKYSEAVGITAPFSNPLVICALSLAPVTGGGRSSIRAFVSMARWTALPMPQPRMRGSLPVMPLPRAQELLGDAEVRLLSPIERRLASAPGGVIVIE